VLKLLQISFIGVGPRHSFDFFIFGDNQLTCRPCCSKTPHQDLETRVVFD
jgi:hypothetical protein